MVKRKYDLIWCGNEVDDEKDTCDIKKEEKKKNSNDAFLGDDSNLNDIKVIGNHIYYYSNVTKKSALLLNTKLKELDNTLFQEYNKHNGHQEYIYLHINSLGGSVLSAFSIIDTIKNLKVPIVSIIEGGAASASTLISIVCDYKLIYPTSMMLIHQLSSSTWGKMEELEEEMENLKKMMESIKDLYKSNTKIPHEDLDEILKHDKWWSAEFCLSMGLVDKIYKSERKFKLKSDMIEL